MLRNHLIWEKYEDAKRYFDIECNKVNNTKIFCVLDCNLEKETGPHHVVMSLLNRYNCRVIDTDRELICKLLKAFYWKKVIV